MSIDTYIKAPGATLDYSLDWASWLAPGETILTSTWAVTGGSTPTADPLDLVQTQNIIVPGAISTTVWLTAGLSGVSYNAANTVVTSAGRTDTRSIEVQVWPR